MGPITLFDKSFLQSLSVDESLWFDHFFLAHICPPFFLETLADLAKAPDGDREPEAIVRSLADKFPEMSGAPSVLHTTLALGDLYGHAVEMRGRIHRAGGRYVKKDGKLGIIYEASPEAEACERWVKGEFREVERLFAKHWRDNLEKIDLKSVAEIFATAGISGKSVKSLEHAKAIATVFVDGDEHRFERLLLSLLFLNVPPEHLRLVQERWVSAGQPPLRAFAPYAAYVLEVELFFHIAIAANLISPDRVSNRTDIAYLFYLPFCSVFVSGDKLHQRCAPHFLRGDQSFVWAPDLKSDLASINARFAALPDETKAKGVMSFARDPGRDSFGLVAQLWDKHLGRWRDRKEEPDEPDNPMLREKLAEHVRSIGAAQAASESDIDIGPDGPDSMIIKRSIRRRKGSWWQLPKDLKD